MKFRLIEIGWCVMVWVRGLYCGTYRYETQGQAIIHVVQARPLKVLGCCYRVKRVMRLERVA